MVESKLYKLLGEDGKILLSKKKGLLGGHKGQKVYGRLDCPSALRALEKQKESGHETYVKQRVFFADEATAVKAGYRPCGCCLKEKYQEWKSQTPDRKKTFPGQDAHQPRHGSANPDRLGQPSGVKLRKSACKSPRLEFPLET